jgi:hypothetical protein
MNMFRDRRAAPTPSAVRAAPVGVKSLFVALSVVGVVLIAAAYASAFAPGGAPAWGTWCMIVGSSDVLAAIAALGAVRHRGDLARLGWVALFVFAVLVLGFGLAFGLPTVEAPGARLYLGLPLRAALIVYGVGGLPLLVLPLAYAVLFERLTLRDEDLARVRAAAAIRQTQNST